MLGFEASYVLESSDGLGYTKAKPIPREESEEEKLNRLRRLREEERQSATFKSLREQLRENKERADEEYKEKVRSVIFSSLLLTVTCLPFHC